MAKNTNPSGLKTWLCLKWYGGSEKKVAIDSSEYKQYEIEFTYTGATGTDAGKNTRAAIWVERGNSGNVYVDDWSLQISSDLKSLSVENGALKAEYNADYQGEMKSSDFDISYTSSLEPEVAKKLDLIPEGKFNFLWITQFPFFEWNEDTQHWDAMHHPFTMPMDECLPYLDSDPARVTAKAFDLVLNGTELSSGSIRITDYELQEKMFQALGLTDEEI